MAVTVTCAEADFVGSATLVAFTVNVPAVLGAVYRPEAEIAPPVAVQVTAEFDVPLTLAVNCWVPPVCNDAEFGETVTVTTGAAVTVTWADPDLVESAALVAVTV